MRCTINHRKKIFEISKKKILKKKKRNWRRKLCLIHSSLHACSTVPLLALNGTTGQMMRWATTRIDGSGDVTVVNAHLLSKSPELAVKSCSLLLIKRSKLYGLSWQHINPAGCRAWIVCVQWKDLVVVHIFHVKCNCYHGSNGMLRYWPQGFKRLLHSFFPGKPFEPEPICCFWFYSWNLL